MPVKSRDSSWRSKCSSQLLNGVVDDDMMACEISFNRKVSGISQVSERPNWDHYLVKKLDGRMYASQNRRSF